LWEPDFPVAEVTGLPDILPTTLATRFHDAEPDHVVILPGPSIWPLLAALATTLMFIGSVFTPWALVWGAVPVAITLIGWFWPRAEETRKAREIEVKPREASARLALFDEVMS
jgi:cytochrome c oxidase subunit 1